MIDEKIRILGSEGLDQIQCFQKMIKQPAICKIYLQKVDLLQAMTSFFKNLVFFGGRHHFFQHRFFFRKIHPSYSAWLFWCSWTAAFTWAHCCSSGMPLNMVTTPPRRALTEFPRMTGSLGGWWVGFQPPLAIWKNMHKSSNWVKIFPPNGDENNKYTVLEEYIRHSPDTLGFTLTLY